jgi:hypothetical protein
MPKTKTKPIKPVAAALTAGETVPPGYWRNAQGHLVHENLVREVDRERDAVVAKIIDDARKVAVGLSAFKQATMESIAAFVESAAASHGVKLGGKKGNVTLYSFDGRYKIIRAQQERSVFDEGLQAARKLIEECMTEWTKNARYEVKALIERAFEVDKEGMVNVGRVLALRRVDIKDERWQRAMKIIGESLQVIDSKSYVRVYERDDKTGEYLPLALDVAGA